MFVNWKDAVVSVKREYNINNLREQPIYNELKNEIYWVENVEFCLFLHVYVWSSMK